MFPMKAPWNCRKIRCFILIKTYSKSIELKKGMHPIEVQFFGRGGQEYLFVQWSRPGFEKMPIPVNNFYLKHD